MEITERIVALCAICLISLCTNISNGEAALINALSCSIGDVTAAYNTASAGDTVVIPAGSCSWSTGLTISKAITLKGGGRNATTISDSGTGTLITVSLSSDVRVRITGIYFKYLTNRTGGTAIHINGKTDGRFGLTKIRIDNNRFEKGTRTVHATGWTYGVIDRNQFVNCNIAVGITGDNNYSWSRPIAAGTANALFIEDNFFIIDNNADQEPNEQIYHQEGGRTVIRYNTFNGSTYTAGNYLFFDSHGNWGEGLTESRGQPIIEVYRNTIYVRSTYRHMNVRGGSLLVHNNTFTGGSSISLSEEEAWTSGGLFNPKPAATAWPAWDQVTNSFFWNNTLNGAAFNPTSVDPEFIQKDRDYFLHAPQNFGGKSIYPTAPGGNDMTFSSSGSNAYYPYTPYTYPHPLTSPYPPRNLSIRP